MLACFQSSGNIPEAIESFGRFGAIGCQVGENKSMFSSSKQNNSSRHDQLAIQREWSTCRGERS